eukprot:2371386-Rhodomonas_salina.1
MGLRSAVPTVQGNGGNRCAGEAKVARGQRRGRRSGLPPFVATMPPFMAAMHPFMAAMPLFTAELVRLYMAALATKE